MSTGILLITHPGIGQALLANTSALLERCPLQTGCLEVPPDSDPEALVDLARSELRRIDDGNGVLVLTDAFGSTPSNIACRAADQGRAHVISGVNLPMLIRIFNYPGDTLESLSCKALEGGRHGIRLTPADEEGCP